MCPLRDLKITPVAQEPKSNCDQCLQPPWTLGLRQGKHVAWRSHCNPAICLPVHRPRMEARGMPSSVRATAEGEGLTAPSKGPGEHQADCPPTPQHLPICRVCILQKYPKLLAIRDPEALKEVRRKHSPIIHAQRRGNLLQNT